MNVSELTTLKKYFVPWGHGVVVNGDTSNNNSISPGLLGVYYFATRILKPEKIVAIGSLRGAAPASFALGCRDNGFGRVYFIDCALIDDFWKGDKTSHWKRLSIEAHIELIVDRSENYFPTLSRDFTYQILYIDGDHTFKGVQRDFSLYFQKLNGWAILHDSHSTGTGFNNVKLEVKDFVDTYLRSTPGWELIDLPSDNGVTFVTFNPKELDLSLVTCTRAHFDLAERWAKSWNLYVQPKERTYTICYNGLPIGSMAIWEERGILWLGMLTCPIMFPGSLIASTLLKKLGVRRFRWVNDFERGLNFPFFTKKLIGTRKKPLRTGNPSKDTWYIFEGELKG